MCNCNAGVERFDKYYEEGHLVEYKERCAGCKRVIGHMAYDYWEENGDGPE